MLYVNSERTASSHGASVHAYTHVSVRSLVRIHARTHSVHSERRNMYACIRERKERYEGKNPGTIRCRQGAPWMSTRSHLKREKDRNEWIVN